VYEIPATGKVTVSIWNMQGQRTGTTIIGIKPKGRHEVKLDNPALNLDKAAAGNYVLLLDVNGKMMRKQFILNR
jgi:hypothetical protein